MKYLMTHKVAGSLLASMILLLGVAPFSAQAGPTINKGQKTTEVKPEATKKPEVQKTTEVKPEATKKPESKKPPAAKKPTKPKTPAPTKTP
ncbi:hypothetical protein B7O87_11515 [Cylindrospermopsis raciborskii CENA303]|uniref:Uncharacterized protein n=1 Tax=Cylindrospermopsis raciborskii CENA303 TaxID=1170769 RepID=A0A1X4G5J0_9CYAN|nr:hypothetical protein [Cylindrospermopsis raciborskii]OSO89769.1 hypothetical protein B7O87_11515 [Cylindrospermopsis raciborskii CENA303]